MAKRLVADARIVLARAGYETMQTSIQGKVCLRVEIPFQSVDYLLIEGGTVPNAHVTELLIARGYDEFGRKIKS